jgi:hypothetical protein
VSARGITQYRACACRTDPESGGGTAELQHRGRNFGRTSLHTSSCLLACCFGWHVWDLFVEASPSSHEGIIKARQASIIMSDPDDMVKDSKPASLCARASLARAYMKPPASRRGRPGSRFLIVMTDLSGMCHWKQRGNRQDDATPPIPRKSHFLVQGVVRQLLRSALHYPACRDSAGRRPSRASVRRETLHCPRVSQTQQIPIEVV